MKAMNKVIRLGMPVHLQTKIKTVRILGSVHYRPDLINNIYTLNY
ncbi:hypothetical protein BTN49_1680 [Candidatus Enterovibrio escicola]|uniref:Uncharacterized protein n=1 Tax=Candidatus Enterovibrio escicola TaxID=1927127 RepID=A0A2A5T3J2_9GAMM|nr:hypothetical protein BTN49_1680 [Candidatus Enterovibrio escacola]